LLIHILPQKSNPCKEDFFAQAEIPLRVAQSCFEEGSLSVGKGIDCTENGVESIAPRRKEIVRDSINRVGNDRASTIALQRSRFNDLPASWRLVAVREGGGWLNNAKVPRPTV
jgi:hypothetical protein